MTYISSKLISNMKHTWTVTAALVLLFLAAQIIGLVAISANTVVSRTPGGEVVVSSEDTVIGERPNFTGYETFLYVMFAVLLGTGLILLLIRLRRVKIWKAMYFFAVWMTCTITLGVFINGNLALIICLVLAILKIFKPNRITHNATELLMYPGIALIFVPILDITWALALLLVISAYDMFAVWKSRHMVRMAEFQTKSKAFAGLSISYSGKKKLVKKKAKETGEGIQQAVLGGGDIAFPLIFAGVVMISLIQNLGFPKTEAFVVSLIIPIIVSIVLLTLLVKGQKGKFYPAMPFITAGCLIGYALIWGLGFLI
jgi:presenilin-like A22 family membrane protease